MTKHIKTFLDNGSWVAPAGVRIITLCGFGGGAGGGGGSGSRNIAYRPPIGGGGGGASLQSTQIYIVNPGELYDIFIGGGGYGYGGEGGHAGVINGAGTTGNRGDSTTFSPNAGGINAIFSGAYPGQGGVIGTHAYGEGSYANCCGSAAGGTGTSAVGFAPLSRTYSDSMLRFGSGPGCGGDGMAYVLVVTGLSIQAVNRGGFQSIEGFSGGSGGDMGMVYGDQNFTPGGPGGGGAGGPGGVGGSGGDGGANRIGGAGGIGLPGADAAVNTGAGGGGGGAAGTGDSSGAAGGNGGKGGSGKLIIIWET